MIWQFDESVAKRFQHEAITNIPDYERVISLCIDIVNNNYPKETKIVDVGSALGYTMDRFIQNGYTRERVEGINTLDDLSKYVRYNSKIKMLIQFMKLWASKSKMANSDFKSYGLNIRLNQVICEKPIEKQDKNSDLFVEE